MARRGGGVGLATKGLGLAYGFIGFIGGLVVDYVGRVVSPADRTTTNITALDMVELGGGVLSSMIGYLSPSHGEWVPISAGLVNGMLYAKIFGPRLFRNRYILTSINSAGQLVSGAAMADDGSQFGGGYGTYGLDASSYPILDMYEMSNVVPGDMGTSPLMDDSMSNITFANTGPVGDADLSDIYDMPTDGGYGNV